MDGFGTRAWAPRAHRGVHLLPSSDLQKALKPEKPIRLARLLTPRPRLKHREENYRRGLFAAAVVMTFTTADRGAREEPMQDTMEPGELLLGYVHQTESHGLVFRDSRFKKAAF